LWHTNDTTALAWYFIESLAWCLRFVQQYVGGQPVMQLQLAQQQAGAQELYSNGYADGGAAAGSNQKQMAPARQSSADYR